MPLTADTADWQWLVLRPCLGRQPICGMGLPSLAEEQAGPTAAACTISATVLQDGNRRKTKAVARRQPWQDDSRGKTTAARLWANLLPWAAIIVRSGKVWLGRRGGSPVESC